MSQTQTKDREQIGLTFVDAAGKDSGHAPFDIRCRLLLKHALRSLALRCVSLDGGKLVKPEPALDAAKVEPPF